MVRPGAYQAFLFGQSYKGVDSQETLLKKYAENIFMVWSPYVKLYIHQIFSHFFF